MSWINYSAGRTGCGHARVDMLISGSVGKPVIDLAVAVIVNAVMGVPGAGECQRIGIVTVTFGQRITIAVSITADTMIDSPE